MIQPSTFFLNTTIIKCMHIMTIPVIPVQKGITSYHNRTTFEMRRQPSPKIRDRVQILLYHVESIFIHAPIGFWYSADASFQMTLCANRVRSLFWLEIACNVTACKNCIFAVFNRHYQKN